MTEPDRPLGGAAPGPIPGSGPAPTRIGNAERQQAMDALDVHMSAGRLDPDEYGERVGQASVARTTADLEPLFADLPAPHATDAVTPAAAGSAATRSGGSTTTTPGWTPPAPDRRGRKHHSREPLGGRLGEVAAGLSPFVALGLFLLFHSWVFFLLIPIVGVIVYGRDDHDHKKRDRR